MSLQLITRLAAAGAVLVGVAGYTAADLKGDYNLEFVVQQTTYAGKAKTVAGAKGEFSGTFEFSSPTAILAAVTGKSAGDSITFSAKYEDKGRGCTGTFNGKGTAAKDGSKASGSVDISDSCSG